MNQKNWKTKKFDKQTTKNLKSRKFEPKTKKWKHQKFGPTTQKKRIKPQKKTKKTIFSDSADRRPNTRVLKYCCFCFSSFCFWSKFLVFSRLFVGFWFKFLVVQCSSFLASFLFFLMFFAFCWKSHFFKVFLHFTSNFRLLVLLKKKASLLIKLFHQAPFFLAILLNTSYPFQSNSSFFDKTLLLQPICLFNQTLLFQSNLFWIATGLRTSSFDTFRPWWSLF